MKTINSSFEDIYIINKSKFISFVFPVSSENDCKSILEKIRHDYADATHVCFACILSSPRVEKCSDDGEPTGTAGKPILELLKKKNLENIVCAVVRYFGGKKLGAGGLIRAYTNSANLVVGKCEIVDVVPQMKVEITCKLSGLEKLKYILKTANANILDIEYINDTAKVIANISDSDKLTEYDTIVL